MVSTSSSQPSEQAAEQERFEAEQANNALLAELALWGEAFRQSEESGEGRVTIFLAAVGAAATSLPVVIDRPTQSGKAALPILFLFLLFLGLSTLFRLVRRNIESDRCLRRQWTIRSYFAEVYGSRLLAGAYPEALVTDPTDKKRERKLVSLQFFFGQGGGHVELVEWANAELTGMMVYALGVLAIGDELDLGILAISIVIGVTFRIAEFQWTNSRYERERRARLQAPMSGPGLALTSPSPTRM